MGGAAHIFGLVDHLPWQAQGKPRFLWFRLKVQGSERLYVDVQISHSGDFWRALIPWQV